MQEIRPINSSSVRRKSSTLYPCIICALIVFYPPWRVREKSPNAPRGKSLAAATEVFGDSPATRLVEALSRGDADAVNGLVDSGADINTRGRHEVTPLLFLLARREVEPVKLALQFGADPNLAADEKDAPLYYAVAMDLREELLKALISAGADVERASELTRLQYGLPIEHLVLEHVIRHRGPEGKVKVAGAFPAVPGESAQPLWWLLENGGNVNAQNRVGACLLLSACETRHFDIAYGLLERGANPLAQRLHGGSFADWLNRWPLNPLADIEAGWIAAIQAKVEQLSATPETIRQAAEIDANFADFREQYGKTEAGEHFLRSRRPFRVQQKWYGSADGTQLATATEIFTDSHTTMLVEALSNDDADGAHRSIQSGADINARGRNEVTPLLFLVAHQKVGGVELALKLGADPNLAARDTDSPLYYAVQTDRWEELLKLLVVAGADIKKASDMGRLNYIMPLEHLVMSATRSRFYKRGFTMVTAAFPARPGGSVEPLWWLLEHGGDVNAQEADGGTTMLSSAYRTRNFDVAYELLERGLNPLIPSRGAASFATWLTREQMRPDGPLEAGWTEAIQKKVDQLSGDPEFIRQAAEVDASFAEFSELYRKTPHGARNLKEGEEMRAVVRALEKLAEEAKKRENTADTKID